MTRLTLFIVAASTVATPLASQQRTDIRAEVQGFVRQYVDATNKADAAALVEMYARIPEVASISDGDISRGWEAIRSEADSLLGLQGGYRLDVGSIDVVTLGPTHALAFAAASVTLPTQHGPAQFRGAFTLVVRKVSGAWKIIHDHSSLHLPSGQGE